MPRQRFHIHECDRCAHLLSMTTDGRAVDVYRCSHPEKEGILGTTFLLRFSDDPPDYWSGPLDIVGSLFREHGWMRAVLRALVADSAFSLPKRQMLDLWLRRLGEDLISDTAAVTALRECILRAPAITGEKTDG